MYKRILLAYDGSVEGAVALREGALLAKHCGAKVFALCVIPDSGAVRLADSINSGPMARQLAGYKELLDRGVERLRGLGLDPVARFVVGEPVRAIGAFAKEVRADLVVVGHQRQSMLERWWSGPSGAYVSDNVRCTILIARNAVSDAAFEAEIQAGEGASGLESPAP